MFFTWIVDSLDISRSSEKLKTYFSKNSFLEFVRKMIWLSATECPYYWAVGEFSLKEELQMSRLWLWVRYGANHLVYLQPFCLIASNFNRRSSGNQLLFLILSKVVYLLYNNKYFYLCYLQGQIHFWWYSNQMSCNNIFLDLRPYNYHETIFIDT